MGILLPIGDLRSPVGDNMINWGFCLLVLYKDIKQSRTKLLLVNSDLELVKSPTNQKSKSNKTNTATRP